MDNEPPFTATSLPMFSPLPRERTPVAAGHVTTCDNEHLTRVGLTNVSPLWSMHPRRPRGSQSGREERRDESFQVRAKEPLGTDSHRTISKNSSGCRLLIGHKKCFVLLCPIGENISMSSFRVFVHDGYCLDHGLSSVLLAYAPKKCTQSGNFQFDIKSPSDPTRLLCQMQANSSGAEYPSS